MTLANRITIARLAMAPFFVALVISYDRGEPWLRWAAFAVFIIAGLSDALDGFLARAMNQRTRLGAMLDPFADKLLINGAFVVLAINQEFLYPVPPWFPVILLGRDAIIAAGWYLINEHIGPLRVKPRISGKLNTALQMALVLAVLLEWSYSPFLLIVTTVIAVISFIDYLIDGVRRIGDEDKDKNG